jgi:hypothetical protein
MAGKFKRVSIVRMPFWKSSESWFDLNLWRARWNGLWVMGFIRIGVGINCPCFSEIKLIYFV